MQAASTQKAARWQPPSKSSGPAFKIDDRILAKVAEMNPAMAAGRTAAQMRKELLGNKPSPVTAPGAPCAAEMDQALTFFLNGKADALQHRMAEIVAKRRALDTEEQELKVLFKQQLQSFVALLNSEAVRMHAPSSLAKHQKLLSALDINVADVIVGRTK